MGTYLPVRAQPRKASPLWECLASLEALVQEACLPIHFKSFLICNSSCIVPNPYYRHASVILALEKLR